MSGRASRVVFAAGVALAAVGLLVLGLGIIYPQLLFSPLEPTPPRVTRFDGPDGRTVTMTQILRDGGVIVISLFGPLALVAGVVLMVLGYRRRRSESPPP